jgi:hypothetical protein
LKPRLSSACWGQVPPSWSGAPRTEKRLWVVIVEGRLLRAAVSARVVQAEVGVGGDVLEHAADGAQVLDLGPRQHPGLASADGFDADQPLGLGKGQRPQQQRADHGEDRRVRADAEGEGREHRNRECGLTDEQAPGVAHVGEEGHLQ